jgi:hypothetical protein
MAKKTRIDRRGKIRSITSVARTIQQKKPFWKNTKYAAVQKRRRIVDEVFAAENLQITDSIVPHLERFITSGLSTSDAVNIANAVLMISEATIADDGTIVKDFQQPANADSISFGSSIGFDLGSLSSMFNAGKLNETTFGALMAEQEFYNDSLTASDSVVLESLKPVTETATITDSIGFTFEVGSLMNAAPMGLSQFNN